MEITYQRLFSAGQFEHRKIGLNMETSKENLDQDFKKLVETVYGLNKTADTYERYIEDAVHRQSRIQALESELEMLKGQEQKQLE